MHEAAMGDLNAKLKNTEKKLQSARKSENKKILCCTRVNYLIILL